MQLYLFLFSRSRDPRISRLCKRLPVYLSGHIKHQLKEKQTLKPSLPSKKVGHALVSPSENPDPFCPRSIIFVTIRPSVTLDGSITV